MTREELNKFMDGDCLVKYDGEMYYFDSTAKGILWMRDINNDRVHLVPIWNLLHGASNGKRYTVREF